MVANLFRMECRNSSVCVCARACTHTCAGAPKPKREQLTGAHSCVSQLHFRVLSQACVPASWSLPGSVARMCADQLVITHARNGIQKRAAGRTHMRAGPAAQCTCTWQKSAKVQLVTVCVPTEMAVCHLWHSCYRFAITVLGCLLDEVT